jgi:two-component system cell cycle sensor histidine kinase/response regulator CckA
MYETILVVDDESEMRSFVAAALQALGYIVLDTADPQQALRIVKDQPVHLLLTDVVMPLMKGTELADRVQAVSPSTKMLLTGYHTSDIAPSGRPFLAKPFRIESLKEKVRDVLARPSASARPRRAP